MATALAATAILLGALLWFLPYLTSSQVRHSSVPAPTALSAVSSFSVAAGTQACMSAVAVEPSSRLAVFEIAPGGTGATKGPPVELSLEAQGFRTASVLPGGYPAGVVSLGVTPPRRSRLVTACFLDRGPGPIVLTGSAEARTISRSGTTVAGTPVAGDIALTFLDPAPHTLLGSLGTIFGHASNLTDRLLPVWLIWVLALLTALGVPIGVLAAFYAALTEDEARAGAPAQP